MPSFPVADSRLPRRTLEQGRRSGRWLLRWIAVFKLFKCTVLITVGIGVHHLLQGDVAATLTEWARHMRVDPGNKYLAMVLHVERRDLTMFSVGTFLFAGVFGLEGVGLWLEKRWAEWFTVIASGLLLPLEAYEMWDHPHYLRALVLLVNLMIVIYLARYVYRNTSAARPGG